MKIAIFASTDAVKAHHLHEFFKEGNRVKLDTIFTDNPTSPFIEEMRAEGVEVVTLTSESDGAQLAEILRSRNVELIVIDDFNGEIPTEVRKAYGEAIVTPTTLQSAPLDVITTADRINAVLRNRHEESPSGEMTTKQQGNPTDPNVSDVEKEWADVLEIDMRNTNPQSPQTPKPSQPPEYHAQQPVAPDYGSSPAPQNPIPPQYSYNRQQNINTPQEPMPETYLVWSVVITLLCCLVTGVIAIIYSASVSSKYYRGDIEGAKRASRNAQIWCIVSIVCGIIWATLYMPLSLLIG